MSGCKMKWRVFQFLCDPPRLSSLPCPASVTEWGYAVHAPQARGRPARWRGPRQPAPEAPRAPQNGSPQPWARRATPRVSWSVWAYSGSPQDRKSTEGPTKRRLMERVCSGDGPSAAAGKTRTHSPWPPGLVRHRPAAAPLQVSQRPTRSKTRPACICVVHILVMEPYKYMDTDDRNEPRESAMRRTGQSSAILLLQ